MEAVGTMGTMGPVGVVVALLIPLFSCVVILTVRVSTKTHVSAKSAVDMKVSI